MARKERGNVKGEWEGVLQLKKGWFQSVCLTRKGKSLGELEKSIYVNHTSQNLVKLTLESASSSSILILLFSYPFPNCRYYGRHPVPGDQGMTCQGKQLKHALLDVFNGPQYYRQEGYLQPCSTCDLMA